MMLAHLVSGYQILASKAVSCSGFNMFSSMTKAEIAGSWPAACKMAKNFTRLDLKAMRWLETHVETIKVVDTDKN